MKLSALSLLIFLLAGPAAVAAADPAGPAPKIPAKALRFERVPLGNVVRVLSARFATPVTIAANARAPISGDFSEMDLARALAAASGQAGLVVLPIAPRGFILQAPAPPNAAREALLKKRADLLESAARLPH